MDLSIGYIHAVHQSRRIVQVPLDATVDRLIELIAKPSMSGGESEEEKGEGKEGGRVKPSLLDGCAGFLVTKVTKRSCGSDSEYGSEEEGMFDEVNEAPRSGLAGRLTENGGSLLQPGNTLSSYGIDASSCAEIMLYAVFADADKQPTVFRQEIISKGFGDKIYEYVKLNPEDKEIVEARNMIGVMLPSLQKQSRNGDGCAEEECSGQSISFSMTDEFPEAPETILTLNISQDDEELNVCCTNVAGNAVCSLKLAADATVATLQSSLSDMLQWPSVTLWEDSSTVSTASQVSRHSILTAAGGATNEHLCGLYQHYNASVRPAGYSSSGESLITRLILEPGRAGLQHHFKGDYKRAEELRKVVMSDARWSIETIENGSTNQTSSKSPPTQVVRIVGEVVLDRYFVHERSGSQGTRLNGYKCYAMVRIPLDQLEKGQQADDYHHRSTPGSGWTCGSDSQNYSFFLPMCLVHVLRTKPEEATDSFSLRSALNKTGAADFPYWCMTKRVCRYEPDTSTRISAEILEMIKHLRQGIASRTIVTMEEIMEVQAFAPKCAPVEGSSHLEVDSD